MELREFRGRLYGKYDKHLFIYQSNWDNFRPFPEIKSDIFDPYYGFGTQEMKRICSLLMSTTELDNNKVITNPELFYRWSNQDVFWIKDRPCPFADISLWKSYVNKARTLRTAPPNFKKRTLRKY